MKKKNISAYAFAMLYMMVLPLMAEDADLKKKAEQFMQKSELVFVENKGQIKDSEGKTRPDIRYIARAGKVTVYFMKDRISYVFNRSNDDTKTVARKVDDRTKAGKMYRMDMELIGSSSDVAMSTDKPVATTFNFISSSSDKTTGIQGHKQLVYKNIYKNIDLVFHSTGNGIKYDYVVNPGGDVRNIRYRYAGAEDVKIVKGELMVTTPAGTVTEEAPLSYLTKAYGNDVVTNVSAKNKVKSKYALGKDGVVSFNIPEYDHSKTLVVDPNLRWATYYGGMRPVPSTDDDVAMSVTLAQDNLSLIVVGWTESTLFPTFNGIWTILAGGKDAFWARFNATSGARVWATYYGGTSDEEALSVTKCDAGTDYIGVCGWTRSTNLWVPSAFQLTNSGSIDGFAARISLNTGGVYWATYFGGTADDYAEDISYVGGIYDTYTVAGWTVSNDIAAFNIAPTAPYVYNGGEDAFYLMTNNGINLGWGYLGSTGNDGGKGIATGTDAITGFPFFAMTGYAESGFTGVTNAYAGGTSDAFVTVMDMLTQTQTWCLYYGDFMEDRGEDICLTQSNKSCAMIGWSDSPTFQMSTNSGFTDVLRGVFLTMNGLQQNPPSMCLLGGAFNDYGYDIAVAPNQIIAVTGKTQSTNFPTREPFQPTKRAPLAFYDAFVGTYDPLMSGPFSMSYYGATGISSNTIGHGVTFGPMNDDLVYDVAIVGESIDGQLTLFAPFIATQTPGQKDPFIAVFRDISKFPTYLGGSSADYATDIAYSSADYTLVVTGYTNSNDFPASIGTYAGSFDAFVTKFDPNGNHLWSLYYGGTQDDKSFGVAVDGSGNIAIAGETFSTTGISGAATGYVVDQAAAWPMPWVPGDAFLAKFDPFGSRLFGTYLAGDFQEALYDVTFDSNNDIIVTGNTASWTLGLGTGANTTYTSAGGLGVCAWNSTDVITGKYLANGTASWRYYLGGAEFDGGLGVAVDASNDVYVTGYTRSVGFGTGVADWPKYGAPSPFYTAAAPNTCPGALADAFLAKYTSGGTSPWSVEFGNILPPVREDVGTAVTVFNAHGAGEYVYVTGYTKSTDQTEWAPSSACATCGTNNFNAFVNKFDLSGNQWVTRLHGDARSDYADAIVSSGNDFYITGKTNGDGAALNRFIGVSPTVWGGGIGGYDAFITKFSSALTPTTNFVYGGSLDDEGTGITVLSNGKIFICGSTDSKSGSGNPIPTALFSFQPGFVGGASDAFVAKIHANLASLAKDAELPSQGYEPVKGLSPVQDIDVYPNPAVDMIMVEKEFAVDTKFALEIADALGKTVFSQELSSGIGRFSTKIDVTELNQGVYILRMKTAGGEFSAKFIKQ